jgi:hypothetical protein
VIVIASVQVSYKDAIMNAVPSAVAVVALTKYHKAERCCSTNLGIRIIQTLPKREHQVEVLCLLLVRRELPRRALVVIVDIYYGSLGATRPRENWILTMRSNKPTTHKRHSKRRAQRHKHRLSKAAYRGTVNAVKDSRANDSCNSM